jgi:hypothetical protein
MSRELLRRLEQLLGTVEKHRPFAHCTDQEIMEALEQAAAGERPALLDRTYPRSYYEQLSDEQVLSQLEKLQAEIDAENSNKK